MAGCGARRRRRSEHEFAQYEAALATIETSTWTTKVGLARMLSGGVIMDVVTADQAKLAQEAGGGGCRDLGEALRRIGEGAAMIRTKGEAGTGNIVEAVRHMRAVMRGIRELAGMRPDELYAAAKELRAPLDVVRQTATLGELPVPNFSAGGVATPADASLMRQLGAQSVFVGSGIFK